MISSKPNFEFVVKMFIELRQKGTSLSATDLILLEQWEQQNLDPDFICKVMSEMYQEYERKQKPFPKTFVKISKRIDTIIQKMKDV